MLPYKCDVCDTYFKYKRQCDEHVITCSLADKRLRERRENIDLKDDAIPNPRVMYELLKIALSKCAALEQEVEHLKKTAYKERKRIDVMDYLHNHVQGVGEYNAFMDGLRDIRKEHLDAVFNGNIVDGVIALVQGASGTEHQGASGTEHQGFGKAEHQGFGKAAGGTPFVSFSHKPGQIYTYIEQDDAPPRWAQLVDNGDTVSISKMFDVLANRFINAYTAWSKTVPELNEDTEESQNKKIVLTKKIWAMYLSDDFKYQKFKSWLYNHVKRDAKSIVEYEF